MAAVLGRTEVGVKEFGTTVTIPNDPRARLMNYRLYNLLTEAETDALVSLCFLLSPDELNDKVIIQDDTLCGESNNAFFEISAVRHNLLMTNSIVIGGQQCAVSKIMVYKRQWILKNWVEPMKAYAGRLERIATGGAALQQRNRSVPSYQSIPRPQHDLERSNKGGRCCSCTLL
ncbi:hypothetical protein MAR_037301 [Mya arenaria]|uniref:Uncharacterized protein n=1 Tax=Mya arenaria TaxID=6604 RepID=A0ABY7FNC4_MYAAR|nr:hypothetical protein MAR_037301 [Mya arenaria]